MVQKKITTQDAAGFSAMADLACSKSLRALVEDALHSKYGPHPDVLIQERLTAEWQALERHSAVSDVAALYRFTLWLKTKNIPYFMQHTSGSSFILYLLNITSGNPLPSHSRCPMCGAVYHKPLYPDGFDIPQDFCEDPTGTPVILDAPDPAANLHCAIDGCALIHDGHNIPSQTLWGYEDSFLQFDLALPLVCYGKVSEYISSNFPALCVCDKADELTKSLTFSKIRCAFVLDTAADIPGFHDHICSAADHDFIMAHWKLLAADTDAPPDIPAPNNIADVFSVAGMLFSSGVCDSVTRFMTDHMLYHPSDLIVFRDDIYHYLLAHGFSAKAAWKGMEQVRKGRGLPAVTGEMLQARDCWVLHRCENVRYLCAKAHAVESVFFKLKLLKAASAIP